MRMLAVLLALAFCLDAPPGPPAATCGPEATDGARGALAVGDPAPDWKLADPEGRTHTLSDYRGRVVVLDFWASWCGSCSKVMPRMEKLQQKYKDRGVVVLGVNLWEKGDPVEVWKKKRLTYGLLLKGEEVAAAYGVTGLPVVYVIGVDGRVIYYQAGPEEKNLKGLIEKHLRERDTQTGGTGVGRWGRAKKTEDAPAS